MNLNNLLLPVLAVLAFNRLLEEALKKATRDICKVSLFYSSLLTSQAMFICSLTFAGDKRR